jgi:hypothetical protein
MKLLFDENLSPKLAVNLNDIFNRYNAPRCNAPYTFFQLPYLNRPSNFR